MASFSSRLPRQPVLLRRSVFGFNQSPCHTRPLLLHFIVLKGRKFIMRNILHKPPGHAEIPQFTTPLSARHPGATADKRKERPAAERPLRSWPATNSRPATGLPCDLEPVALWAWSSPSMKPGSLEMVPKGHFTPACPNCAITGITHVCTACGLPALVVLTP